MNRPRGGHGTKPGGIREFALPDPGHDRLNLGERE